jgi:hypothetical protein
MGGEPAGPIDRVEHAYALWEERVDALMMLLGQAQLLKVDELRRNVEALSAERYAAMGYYDRWIWSITQTLLQRGVISSDELGRALERVPNVRV